MSRDRDGRGYVAFLPYPGTSLTCSSTVEFETLEDLKRACAFLDQREFKGYRVTCLADVRLQFL